MSYHMTSYYDHSCHITPHHTASGCRLSSLVPAYSCLHSNMFSPVFSVSRYGLQFSFACCVVFFPERKERKITPLAVITGASRPRGSPRPFFPCCIPYSFAFLSVSCPPCALLFFPSHVSPCFFAFLFHVMSLVLCFSCCFMSLCSYHSSPTGTDLSHQQMPS